jgi:hypothetical protein
MKAAQFKNSRAERETSSRARLMAPLRTNHEPVRRRQYGRRKVPHRKAFDWREFFLWPRENFLGKTLDGFCPTEELLARFNRRFGVEMSEERSHSFEE